MRLTDKDLHPSILQEISRTVWSTAMGADGDKAAMQAYMKHQAAWWKAYGWSFSLWSLFWFLIWIGSISLSRQLDKPWGPAIVLGTTALVAVAAYVGYKRNQRVATVEELKAVASSLDLSPTQRSYIESIILLAGAKALDAEYANELRQELYKLVDEDIRLRTQRDILAGSIHDSPIQAAMADRERIQERLAATQDDSARETYVRSLQAVDERLRRWEDLKPNLERTEAHLEMTYQIVESVREALVRVHQAPSGSQPIELGSLRARLEAIQLHTDTIDRSLTEVRAIT